jgi:hypothetical protein
MATRVQGRLNLILDADDTLWDSNVHFHEAFDEFTAAELREDLHAKVRRIGAALVERECALLPDVEPTLTALRPQSGGARRPSRRVYSASADLRIRRAMF